MDLKSKACMCDEQRSLRWAFGVFVSDCRSTFGMVELDPQETVNV